MSYSPLEYNITAMSTSIRTYVDEIIGSTKDVLVMLNDNDRIANITKFLQYGDKALGIS